MRYAVVLTIFVLLGMGGVALSQSSSTRGGGTQVFASSIGSFNNALSSSLGNTSLCALYNELSFVNNIAQLPLSNKKGGIGLSYTPWLPLLPVDHTKWFQMNLEGYYVFGENYYEPSTEKLSVIYESYKVGTSRLRDVRGRQVSIKKNGYVLRRQAISFKTSYNSRGNIIGKDENNRSIGESTPFDFSLALGYAVNLKDNFSLGIALRYLQSTIFNSVLSGSSTVETLATDKANSFSGDLYFLYDIPLKDHNKGGVSVGLILANVGTKVEYGSGISGYQPAYLGLGASFTNVYDEQNAFHFTFDLKKSLVHSLPPSEFLTSENLKIYSSYSVPQSISLSFNDFNNFNMGMGAEYIYAESLGLRLGGEWQHNSLESVYRFSAGIGYSFFNRYNVDFAYWVPFGTTSLTPLSHSWSLSASIEL